MKQAGIRLWRHYRLRGRRRAAIAVALVPVVIVAAAACGSNNNNAAKKADVNAGSNTTASTAGAVTAGGTPSTVPSTTVPATTTMSTAISEQATITAVANPKPASCHARGTGLYVLPDPSCTPGATNPQVSQADISSTICTPGWTSTVRPPESYTEPLKATQMVAYGDTDRISDYEEDHLIPLELGGSPTSPQNLWPEPGATPNPKDSVEDAAKRAVCDGSMTLAAAQHAIASNWITFGEQLGVTDPLTAGSSTIPPPATSPAATAAPQTTLPLANTGGCMPLSSSGNCYRPGEFCSDADRGMSGVGAGGEPIKCEDNNGWRWEPT